MEKYQDLFQQAINKWGNEAQLRQAQEECAELIHAISKFLRIPNDDRVEKNLFEEMADVKIILYQLEMMFGYHAKKIDSYVKKKINRLEKRIHANGWPNNKTK